MDASDRHTVLSISPLNATCVWYGEELMDGHSVDCSLAVQLYKRTCCRKITWRRCRVRLSHPNIAMPVRKYEKWSGRTAHHVILSVAEHLVRSQRRQGQKSKAARIQAAGGSRLPTAWFAMKSINSRTQNGKLFSTHCTKAVRSTPTEFANLSSHIPASGTVSDHQATAALPCRGRKATVPAVTCAVLLTKLLCHRAPQLVALPLGRSASHQ